MLQHAPERRGAVKQAFQHLKAHSGQLPHDEVGPWMDGWMDGWTDGWMDDGWMMDGWMLGSGSGGDTH